MQVIRVMWCDLSFPGATTTGHREDLIRPPVTCQVTMLPDSPLRHRSSSVTAQPGLTHLTHEWLPDQEPPRITDSSLTFIHHECQLVPFTQRYHQLSCFASAMNNWEQCYHPQSPSDITILLGCFLSYSDVWDVLNILLQQKGVIFCWIFQPF